MSIMLLILMRSKLEYLKNNKDINFINYYRIYHFDHYQELDNKVIVNNQFLKSSNLFSLAFYFKQYSAWLDIE
ncbi:unnamed protein product [Paramecium octaurelia]|uniref:Uncharacterized protein n=1 Tax=Paramecium octaurelia TaxID=43137 RepID=A0A8S1VX76_PAROT|nr:unnamed protein product [Paramecium octaurelia]